jgi:hypothetical protein
MSPQFWPNDPGMGVSVQRQEFVAPVYTPPQVGDEDVPWQDEDIPHLPRGRIRGLVRSTSFAVCMVVIGSSLAMAWEYSGLRAASASLAWPDIASVWAPGPSQPQPEDQLARLVRELETLKKGVSELSVGMQQLAASNAALQAGQHELRQRLSSLPPNSHWYSDPVALRLRFSLPHRPATPAPTARAAAPETTATARRNEGAPLTLRAPQP